MDSSHLSRIQNFTLGDLPDLDEVVLGALAFLSDIELPELDVHAHTRPLVIGSGNAIETGRILFAETDAVFADEGSYESALEHAPTIDAFYIISASGGKHAVHIAERLANMNRPLYLVTDVAHPPAGAYVSPERVFTYPHIREPYTYNTSTYLSMILGSTQESVSEIFEFITSVVSPSLSINIGSYESYTLILPPRFSVFRSMFETKFDELFGPMVHIRVFTSEEIKHAKTVVSSENQCFISFGIENRDFGDSRQRMHIALPDACGYGALLSIGYYVIGNIQRMKPPYFKMHIEAYCNEASRIFNESIHPIVE